MKYKELIQFEPVTEVIQLRWADEKDKAEKLVSTYVISDRMADVILHRLLPALRLDGTRNGRGLFIVGNYGTGKSHLMSVITAAAEHKDLAAMTSHPAVAAGLQSIAGKFAVARMETGANTMHLRDVVFGQLQNHLASLGVDYSFPSMSEAASNKELLVQMMIAFRQRYPEMGLLIALDELLDYLRARSDRELILDLNFLRELGEACELTPLRFMAGIQEALFDNPRFQFAADSIHRVKARFDQVSIVREDIAYVVSHRLLVKSDEQRRKVRAHLEKFTPLYTAMAERLDQFIDLFPVHPAYIETFERVIIGERRDLLKALSEQMTALLEEELPAGQPGLIAYDAYWRMLSEDPAYRTIPEVRLVQDKARVLSERVQQTPDMRLYTPAALRIIDGLALQRLTQGDIYAPTGLTPPQLRDDLCLHLPVPEPDADFLRSTVETVLKGVSRAVSGQFISHNPENDQYYLDLKKDIDYDAQIDLRASSLEPTVLDRYYFDLVARALELNESSYVPGFRIWQREIPWAGHGITRQGYIFLGAPNERSTAHPERDFYLHFLAPFGNGLPQRETAADEVFFILSNRDEDFDSLVRRYAGAREMSAISSGSNKDQYERKASQALTALSTWLRDNLLRAFTIHHQAEEMSTSEAVGRYRLTLRDLPFRDQVFKLGGALLAGHFSQKFADYPCFDGIELTRENSEQAVYNSLRAVAGGPVQRTAQAVLEGLKLARLENGQLVWTVEDSPYAAYFIERISSLGEGQVLNRSELVQGEPGAERDVRFQLEPEWVIVILAALVRQGIIVVNLPGLTIAEGELDAMSRLSLDQLWRFTSICRPKALPEAALRALFEGLEVDTALLEDARKLESAARALQQHVLTELDGVVRVIEDLREGPRFWGEMVLPAAEQQALRSELEGYRQFLNNLQNLNTPAKLRNLSKGVGEIRAALRARQRLDEARGLFELVRPLQPAVEYLSTAQLLLPSDHPWQKVAGTARSEVLQALRSPAQRSAPGAAGPLKGRLENVKSEYAQAYFGLHAEMRLDRDLDEYKRNLTADPRWARMRALSGLELLSERDLKALEGRLGEVRSCPGLRLDELRAHANCPHCGFSPAVEKGKPAAERLDAAEQDFEALCRQWLEALLANLSTPEAAANIQLLKPAEREEVNKFLQARALPEKITANLLDGLRNALHGLEKLTIDSSEFLLALTKAGMPCTPAELEGRIRAYLQQQFAGKDPSRLRVDIDW